MEVKMIMDLSGFDNYENLVKGIDKSKMVQVQVTVKGKKVKSIWLICTPSIGMLLLEILWLLILI